MTPAQTHIATLPLRRTGLLFTSTVGAMGTHGPVITGTQGQGVGTTGLAMPIGFVGALHTPNGMIFVSGMKSMIVAWGLLSVITGGPWGTTINGEGAAPKEQLSIALITAGGGMPNTVRRRPRNW